MSDSRSKCACPDCVCTVSEAGGVKAEGKLFCSDACAGHHASGNGCGHAGCDCHG